MPSLRVMFPEALAATYVVSGDCVTIGRRPDNTIQIVDRSVSGHHAELQFVDGHYRLHDLGSTNLCFVDGAAVNDFHLHVDCKIAFGHVLCEYSSAPVAAANTDGLTPAQLEADLNFVRSEKRELSEKLEAQQRQIDILSSARLVTGTPAPGGGVSLEAVKKLNAQSEAVRAENAALKQELEKVRQELAAAVRERDAARREAELAHREKAVHAELQSGPKGGTQRIVFPANIGAHE